MGINELLERFLPNYYNRDDVAQYLDFDLSLRGEAPLHTTYENRVQPKPSAGRKP
jgi:hypothetical protein